MPRPRPRSRRRRLWTRRVARVRPRRLWTRRVARVRPRRLWTGRLGPGRRRRRGRGGRAAATVDPLAEPAGPQTAAPDATRSTPDEAAEANAAPATSGRQAAGAGLEDDAEPDGDAADGRDAVAVSPAGSARTRARRRRRAAAKVRTRGPSADALVDEPAAAPATRRARSDGQAAGEPTAGADDQPTG